MPSSEYTNVYMSMAQLPYVVCILRRLRSACTFAQSDTTMPGALWIANKANQNASLQLTEQPFYMKNSTEDPKDIRNHRTWPPNDTRRKSKRNTYSRLLVISKSTGLSEMLRDINTSTYYVCRIEEKMNRINTFHKLICNLTPEIRDILKVLWKRGGIAPKE